MRTLADIADGTRFQLNRKDVLFLRLFCSLLRNNVPRVIKPLCPDNVVIFTDACFEPESRDLVCGIGGVLYLPDGTKQFFSLALSRQQCIALGINHKKQRR